jgi:crossover junction endodeoxyribonuclease RuvC
MHHNKRGIILGIDPGTIVSGYGIIKHEGSSYKPIDFGCIRPPAHHKLSDRYLIIFNGIGDLIQEHQPEAVIVETQYVHKNIQSAIKLGMARGVVIIAAKQKNVPVFEYTPTQAKQAVVGNGRASKTQVQGMIQRLLNLNNTSMPEDAADALALAICHAHSAHFKNIISEL